MLLNKAQKRVASIGCNPFLFVFNHFANVSNPLNFELLNFELFEL